MRSKLSLHLTYPQVDPKRTINSGKVQLGAFRTYPKDYKPPEEGASEYQTIPLEKIEDFGVHVKSYYPLEVSYFKSSLDNHLLELLWNKYWVSTLSSSPILAVRPSICRAHTQLTRRLRPLFRLRTPHPRVICSHVRIEQGVYDETAV